MNERRKMKRGAFQRQECLFIGAWIPSSLMDLVDECVQREDLDRSKMLRRALEEKLRRVQREAA